MRSLAGFQGASSDWMFTLNSDGAEQTDCAGCFLPHSGVSIKGEGDFYSVVSCYV